MFFFFLMLRRPPKPTLTDAVFPYTSLFRSLHEAGAVVLGKRATHEFAFGGPSWDLPFPPARNPWDPSRFTGGSSSGSGSATAGGLAMAAMGSDTAGSIRMPAHFCGIAGIAPRSSARAGRSDEHTSELQSLMRISYAVFC